MQLSLVGHFFILATVLKVFHLKFIHYSSRTSCCFHVEILWHIFICNILIHSLVLHKWYFFCTNLSHNNVFRFLRPRTWTYNNKTFSLCFFILFFIQNAHRVVCEVLVVIKPNFSRLRENIRVFYRHWTALSFLFELHCVFLEMWKLEFLRNIKLLRYFELNLLV